MQHFDERDVGNGPVSDLATGAPGTPIWLPRDGEAEPATNPPSTGSLATSGQDDVERGDTVSGLGSQGRMHPPSSGRQSGQPVPGNRLDAGEARED